MFCEKCDYSSALQYSFVYKKTIAKSQLSNLKSPNEIVNEHQS